MEKLPTPIWDLDEFTDEVYEPREDTFLLIDALENDLRLIKSSKFSIALEIGSGSGIVITSISKAVSDLFCFALDINQNACKATKNTAKINNCYVDVVTSDLVNGLRLDKKIDLLIFNPPYVPSEENEENCILDKAWAGSSKGRRTTDRLFQVLKTLMSNKCLGYLVTIEENDPEEMNIIISNMGFNCVTVAKRKIIGEKLSILRFSRGLNL